MKDVRCSFVVSLCFLLVLLVCLAEMFFPHTSTWGIREALASSFDALEESQVKEIVYTYGLKGKEWILVRKQDFTLTLYRGGSAIASYPVAIGKNDGDKQKSGDMRTPEGVFSVVSVENSSYWVHDFGDGRGPISGAYGPYFIRLKTPYRGIGIHGTHDPNSIGTKATEGCIRLKNEDLLVLVKEVKKGMIVVILP
ncbi:L,D-transpeptidase [Thermovirga sp.]|uniref:L,D-transpeptidase n=1 Tax=Thermovirga sp. TaxID=2699834 RepID=UPI0025FC6C66|nr:L,D-transpeptidase [Thermovirga sp.]